MSRRPNVVPAWLAAFAVLCAAACVDGVPTEVASFSRQADVRFALGTSARLSADEQDALGDAFDRLDEIRIQLFRDGMTEPFVDTLIAVEPGQDTYIIQLTIQTLDATDREVLQVALTGSAGGVELFSARGELTVRAGDTGGGLGGGDSGLDEAVDLSVRYTGPGIRGRIVGATGGSATDVPVELIQNGQVVGTTVTTSDGEYLFTDLEAGSYTVQVAPPSGLVSCPARREVGPLAEESSVVGAFRLSAGDCELRVLVLSAGDIDDSGAVAGSLSGLLPDASLSAGFVVVNPPSLSSLRAYDVVLLFENGSFDDADLIGNRLAEYVEAGGNLVIGGFYWQNRSDSGFGHRGWGALEALDPFASSGGATYGPGALGSVTSHPITQGVTALGVSQWWGGVSSKGGTSVVATWVDGTPLAGHKTLVGGQRLVAISAFPGLMGQCCSTGDFAQLWANAVEWAGAVGGPVQPAPGR